MAPDRVLVMVGFATWSMLAFAVLLGRASW